MTGAITPRHLVDIIWTAKCYEDAEQAVARYEAAIRADQARRDAEIARESGRRQFLAADQHLRNNSPCIVSYGVIAREIERRAGIGEEKSDD